MNWISKFILRPHFERWQAQGITTEQLKALFPKNERVRLIDFINKVDQHFNLQNPEHETHNPKPDEQNNN